MFESHLRRWRLTVDGPAIVTPRAHLLPVRQAGRAAMLKVATAPAEIVGNGVMAWWAGADGIDRVGSRVTTGAAPLLAVDGAAILMARATEEGALVRLLEQGRDDEATRILVRVAAALHAPRRAPPPADVPPLERWFADLTAAADRLGGPLPASARAAEKLLASQSERVVLHGDLHHENVLHFGADGWLAIDPKGVYGERALDHVSHVFDPDDPVAPSLAVLEQRLALIADLAELDLARLRLWLLAWAGLVAVWWSESGASAAAPAVSVAAALERNRP